MKNARANIINALNALENGKSASEVAAWLKDAIRELQPGGRLPVINGYIVTQEGPAVCVVRYPDGDEFARFVSYPDKVAVYLKDRPPVDVKTLKDAVDYIKLVVQL